MKNDPEHPEPDFSLLVGGAELFDRVGPLWLQQRQHHAELAPRWARGLLGKSFEERSEELLNKSAKGLLILIANKSKSDVGYCVSTIPTEASGEIDSLFVVPSCRNRGVGRAMIAKTLEWFTDCGVKSIAVDVIEGNHPAQRFYERFGFATRTTRLMLER